MVWTKKACILAGWLIIRHWERCFNVYAKECLYFWEVGCLSQWMSTSLCVCACVCAAVFTQACLCAWAVPRPGLGGLSEISCKRITDHASLAYWFTAKNTYTYTQNLLRSCSFFFCPSLPPSPIQTHSHPHHALVHTLHLHQWVHLAFKGVWAVCLLIRTECMCVISELARRKTGRDKEGTIVLSKNLLIWKHGHIPLKNTILSHRWNTQTHTQRNLEKQWHTHKRLRIILNGYCLSSSILVKGC